MMASKRRITDKFVIVMRMVADFEKRGEPICVPEISAATSARTTTTRGILDQAVDMGWMRYLESDERPNAPKSSKRKYYATTEEGRREIAKVLNKTSYWFRW